VMLTSDQTLKVRAIHNLAEIDRRAHTVPSRNAA
jgi:hypothetical protein